MAKQSANPIKSEVVETRERLSLSELCQTCCVHADRIVELVDEGILEPKGSEAREWRFTRVSIFRVRTVHRLQEDLGVNLAGIALALDLMDELEALRTRLRKSESSFEPGVKESKGEA